MRRILLLGFLCGSLAFSSGCGLFHGHVHPNHLPSRDHCVVGCGTACGGCSVECGYRHGGGCVDSCGADPCSCGTCIEPCAAGCCETGCEVAGPCVRPCRGPLAFVLGLLHPKTYCGNACGDAYYGSFLSDPPDCCDPCDQCGNFTGGGTCAGGACGDVAYDYDGPIVDLENEGLATPSGSSCKHCAASNSNTSGATRSVARQSHGEPRVIGSRVVRSRPLNSRR